VQTSGASAKKEVEIEEAQPATRLRRVIPWVLALSFSTVVFSSLTDYGVTWDENVYFNAASSYTRWFRNPNLRRIDRFWRANWEHPPLHKVLAGASEFLFHGRLGWMSRVQAYRFPTVLFVFILTFCLFRWTESVYGFPAAVWATLCSFVLPRLFFHAHLAAFDYAMTTFWFVVLYAFWLGRKRRRWVYISAVLLGLALLTKLNAFFLWIPLGVIWLLHLKDELDMFPSGRGKRIVNSFTKNFLPLIIIPPLVFIALWPWLWVDPIGRIGEYMTFHLRHFDVPIFYLGQVYRKGPWHYPFVMLALTTPPLVLAASVWGGVRLWKSEFRRANLHVLFNIFFPLAIVGFSPAPKYDGVRLFLPALPYLAILAGYGLSEAISSLRKPVLMRVGAFAVAIAIVLAAHQALWRPAPHHFAYFNSLVGGTEGAHHAGFDIEYWGSSYKQLLPWLNKNSETRYWVALGMINAGLLKAEKTLSPKVHFGGPKNSTRMILMNRPGMYNAQMRLAEQSGKPLYSVFLGTTPLVTVYELPR
jgi:4-amino-4-deoxy-L-arabinose transferase-like glycosyltransferase